MLINRCRNDFKSQSISAIAATTLRFLGSPSMIAIVAVLAAFICNIKDCDVTTTATTITI